MISIANLDKRICDIEECENTQTYREFIRESEKEFGIYPYPLDQEHVTDEILKDYMEFLDELWCK
ncbi:hypothetical protein AB2063_002981 [Clostridium botulinum]